MFVERQDPGSSGLVRKVYLSGRVWEYSQLLLLNPEDWVTKWVPRSYLAPNPAGTISHWASDLSGERHSGRPFDGFWIL